MTATVVKTVDFSALENILKSTEITCNPLIYKLNNLIQRKINSQDYELIECITDGKLIDDAKDALEEFAKKMTDRAKNIAIIDAVGKVNLEDKKSLIALNTILKETIANTGEPFGNYIELKDGAYTATTNGLAQDAINALTSLANKMNTKAAEISAEIVKVAQDIKTRVENPKDPRDFKQILEVKIGHKVDIGGDYDTFANYIVANDNGTYTLRTDIPDVLTAAAKDALEGLAQSITTQVNEISAKIVEAATGAETQIKQAKDIANLSNILVVNENLSEYMKIQAGTCTLLESTKNLNKDAKGALETLAKKMTDRAKNIAIIDAVGKVNLEDKKGLRALHAILTEQIANTGEPFGNYIELKDGAYGLKDNLPNELDEDAKDKLAQLANEMNTKAAEISAEIVKIVNDAKKELNDAKTNKDWADLLIRTGNDIRRVTLEDPITTDSTEKLALSNDAQNKIIKLNEAVMNKITTILSADVIEAIEKIDDVATKANIEDLDAILKQEVTKDGFGNSIYFSTCIEFDPKHGIYVAKTDELSKDAKDKLDKLAKEMTAQRQAISEESKGAGKTSAPVDDADTATTEFFERIGLKSPKDEQKKALLAIHKALTEYHGTKDKKSIDKIEKNVETICGKKGAKSTAKNIIALTSEGFNWKKLVAYLLESIGIKKFTKESNAFAEYNNSVLQNMSKQRLNKK